MEAEGLELAFKAINNQIKSINGRDKIFQMHIDDQSIVKEYIKYIYHFFRIWNINNFTQTQILEYNQQTKMNF